MPPKILLVDDVTLFLELQKSFLQNSSVEIHTAQSGIQALEVARRERPDLIFMDLHMPEMNGDVCCRTLKATPDLATIPVIMVTTAGRDEDITRCTAAGCDAYLTKPVNRRQFLELGRRFVPAIDRRDERIPHVQEVSYCIEGTEVTAASQDLSPRGVFIAAAGPGSENQVVEVRLHVPGMDEDLRLRGRIAWSNAAETPRSGNLPPGFGIELLDLDEATGTLLKTYLQTLRGR